MEDLQLLVDDHLLPLFGAQSIAEVGSFSRSSETEGAQSPTHTFNLVTADTTSRITHAHDNKKSEILQHAQYEQKDSFIPDTSVEVTSKGQDDFGVGTEQKWLEFPPRSQKPIIVKTKDVTKSKVSSAQELFWASMLQAQLCRMQLQEELDKKELQDVLLSIEPNARTSNRSLDYPTVDTVDMESERVEVDTRAENDEDSYSEEEMEDESLFCDNPLFMNSYSPHTTCANLQQTLDDEPDLICFDEVKCQGAAALSDLPLHGMDQLCPWDVKTAGTCSPSGHEIIRADSLEILQIYEDEQEESNYFATMSRNKKWTVSEKPSYTQEDFFPLEDYQRSTAACSATQKGSEDSRGTTQYSIDDGMLFCSSNFSLVTALFLEQESGHTIPPAQILPENPVAPELPEKTRAHRRKAEAHPVCQGCQVMEHSVASDMEKEEAMDKETVSEQLQDLPVIFIETEDVKEHNADKDLETSSSEDAMYIDNVTNGSGQDLEAARQLATRLFHLDGFEKSQVAPYLQKNTEFSSMVAEEYLSLFDFTGKTLDVALRALLRELVLTGETQERERVLFHFSRRFHSCNPKTFSSSDAVHTLTCALMLLNSDLHGQNIGKCMSLQEFINNLDGMNDGGNFSRDLLKGLYHSIRNEKLQWAMNGGDLTNKLNSKLEKHLSTRKKSNPFIDVPAPDPQAPTYRQGMLLRKVHADIDGKKTPWGKRSWKAFYTVLKGMVLFFLKDEYRTDFQSPEEVISVHHSLAERASEYTKRPHVFRLQTADWRVFLFQAQTAEEMNSWIARINLVTAMFSSPPFPAAIGSQRRFVRPILPVAHCKLSLEEQLQAHESWMDTFTDDLTEHQRNLPDQSSKAKDWEEYHLKEDYLRYEKSRYETYVKLLALRMQSGCEDLDAWETLLTEPDGAQEENCGLKRSHSSPSFNAENSPVVIKVKRNISERRTYRRIIPKRNKNLV